MTIYSWLLILIAFGCGGLAVYSLRYRYQAVSIWFAAVLMGYAIQALGYALELASGHVEWARFWLDFIFIGGAFIPSCVLLMALSYQNHNPPPAWLRNSVLAISSLVLLVQWTTQIHQLGINYLSVRIVNSLTIGDLQFGLVYQLYIVYTHLCALLATLILLTRMWQAPRFFQAQNLSLLIGMIFSWISYGLFVLGWAPNGLDLTVFSGGIIGLFFAYGIFGHQFLLLAPVARHRLFDALPDAVLVLDEQDQLIDFNPQAILLFSELNPKRLGLPPPDAISDWMEQQTKAQAPIALRIGESTYQVIVTPLQIHANTPAQGLILVLRDVSEQQAMIAQLQHHAERDSLTGCLNYAAWQQRLSAAIDQNESFCVVIWDLVRFRDVSDGRGELIGNHLLQNFARHLEHFKPPHSELARLYGDRFVWLVKEADPTQLVENCQTIKAKMEYSLVNDITFAQVEYQPPESHRYVMMRLFDRLREEKTNKQTQSKTSRV